MKRKVFILFLFIITNIIFCQGCQKIGNYYGFSSKKINANCALILLDTSNYYILSMTQNFREGIAIEDYLSWGRYYKKENALTLIDDRYKFNMEVYLFDDSLWFAKSFNFLNQKKFRFNYGSYHRDVKQLNKLLFFLKYDYSSIDIPTLSAVKEATPFDPEDILSFNPESIYCNAVYSLYLNKDNSYKLLFSNALIYEGTWLRDDNILSLYDPMFDFTFFLIIKGKDLINISLYGYDDEFILTLEE